MKINWGTGIIIGFVVFICFIMYMVVNMLTNKEYTHDLVTDQYYEKGTLYQEEIDAETNTQLLSENIKIVIIRDGISITFPKDQKPSNIKGTVSFYRPSNKKLDFDIPLELADNSLLIPDNHLLEGRWNIKVDWIYEGVHYLIKDKITY